VAALINIIVTGPGEAAAAMTIKSLEPVAWGLTPMEIAVNTTKLMGMKAVTRD